MVACNQVTNTIGKQGIPGTNKESLFENLNEKKGLAPHEVLECKVKSLDGIVEMTSKKDAIEIKTKDASQKNKKLM